MKVMPCPICSLVEKKTHPQSIKAHLSTVIGGQIIKRHTAVKPTISNDARACACVCGF